MDNSNFTPAEIARGEALCKGPCTFVKGVVRIDGRQHAQYRVDETRLRAALATPEGR